ncbi:MAG: BadF/BadG/BcrA/BcrD ATPase family protein [Gemmatimonadota bacterium]
MSGSPGAFVVGIDGGGTRTRAVVLAPDGEELGRAEGGATLVSPGTPGGEVLHVLRDVTLSAMENAGVETPAAALHAGLAGVGREWVRAGVEAALRKSFGPESAGPERIASSVRVGTDSAAAFHAAFGTGPGLLVISGTGSIGWGRSETGEWARVGGWGSLLGDEGSGYRIGLDALRATVQSDDGRGEPTALAPAILETLALETTEELVDWGATAAKAHIAKLAPVVRDTARAGDETAVRILERATADLERHVVLLLKRLGPWSTPPGLALCGGLLSPDGVLRQSFLKAVAGHGCRPIETPVDASRGAALLALEEAVEPA